MRARAKAQLSLSLVLAILWPGCREDLVQITLEVRVPTTVVFDQVTVVRFQGPDPIPQIDARFMTGETGGIGHTAGIFVPRDWSTIVVRVRALNHGMVVAEKQLDVSTQATRIVVELAPCEPFSPPQESASCEGPGGAMTAGPTGGPPDAGGGTTDAAWPDDVAKGDAGPARASWVPHACMMVDDTAAPTLPQLPDNVDAHCRAYCDLMQSGCSFVFGPGPSGTEHCLISCTRIGWPLTSPVDQDTLTCRTSWAQLAAQSTSPPERAQQCIHASLDSNFACGNRCENYCHAGNVICPGGYFPEGRLCLDACLAAQRSFMQQWPDQIYGNELLGCRFDWLQRAVFDPALCTRAAPNACPNSPCPDVVFVVP